MENRQPLKLLVLYIKTPLEAKGYFTDAKNYFIFAI